MLRWLTRIAAPVVAIAMLGLATASRADTIQAHLESVVNNGDGTFNYNYQLVLTGGNGISDGNAANEFESGLIILDYVGLTGTPTLSAQAGDLTLTTDWNVGTTATGGGSLTQWAHAGGETTLKGTSPTSSVKGNDLAWYSNVVLEYKGSDMLVSASARDLIHLTLTSTIGVYATETLTLSRDTGPTDSNYPVETYSIAAPVVPLPAAAWAGMALMGFVSANKFRLSRRLQA
jgi:hypothetical protein